MKANIQHFEFTNYFKAAHVFLQSNLSGTWQWNLMGHYDNALLDNESLEVNNNNECHILFVSFIIGIYCFHFYNLHLKCLPNNSLFSMGSSYPPSSHISGSMSHSAVSESCSGSLSCYAFSESHSHPDTLVLILILPWTFLSHLVPNALLMRIYSIDLKQLGC